MSDEKQGEYVLITRYDGPLQPRPVVHAYGPWTRARARREQREALRDAETYGYLDGFHTNVCKILNVGAPVTAEDLR